MWLSYFTKMSRRNEFANMWQTCRHFFQTFFALGCWYILQFCKRFGDCELFWRQQAVVNYFSNAKATLFVAPITQSINTLITNIQVFTLTDTYRISLILLGNTNLMYSVRVCKRIWYNPIRMSKILKVHLKHPAIRRWRRHFTASCIRLPCH